MAARLIQLEIGFSEDDSRAWIDWFDTRDDADETRRIVEINSWIEGTALNEGNLGRIARALFPSDGFRLQLWDEESSQWLDYDEWMGYR